MNEAYNATLADLADRSEWENRQRIWYQMRHTGLPRRNKPFPTAADLHFPLIDSVMGKIDAFYFAQIYGTDLLASFVSKTQQSDDATRAAAVWFDYQLNNETNWFEESLALIDAMMSAGGATLKVVGDGKRKTLVFDSIDPLFFVLPPTAKDLETADRWCHVIQTTAPAYKRNGKWNQDASLIARIKGKCESDSRPEKYNREGITEGTHDEQIVLWECYERTASGIVVRTFSPRCPEENVRDTYSLPDYYGETGPFVWFQTEYKDKGVYSPRGVPERLAPFQSYAKRVWDEKSDAMSFFNRPLFTTDGPLPGNLNNVKLRPGEVLPNNVKRVEMGQVPFDFDQEINQTRMTAEQVVNVPDFAMTSQLNTKERRTATEIQAVTAVSGVTEDKRGRIFRRALGKVYRLSYALLREFRGDELDVVTHNKWQQVDRAALHDRYAIAPDGSPDAWNKEQRLQRAFQRLQMLAQNPFCDVAELTRDVLAEDNPALAARVFKDPKTREVEALTAQARAIAEVTLRLAQDGHPDDPVTIRVLGEALQARLDAIQQINPQAAQAVKQELTAAAQAARPQPQPAPQPSAAPQLAA